MTSIRAALSRTTLTAAVLGYAVTTLGRGNPISSRGQIVNADVGTEAHDLFVERGLSQSLG